MKRLRFRVRPVRDFTLGRMETLYIAEPNNFFVRNFMIFMMMFDEDRYDQYITVHSTSGEALMHIQRLREGYFKKARLEKTKIV